MSRDETIGSLYFVDLGVNPSEDGIVNRNGSDLKGYFGGVLYSLLTGLASINFSYEEIQAAEVITIPERQQMIVHGLLTNEGDLVVEGSLVLEI